MGRVGRIKFGLSPAIISFCLNQLFFFKTITDMLVEKTRKEKRKREGGKKRERERRNLMEASSF